MPDNDLLIFQDEAPGELPGAPPAAPPWNVLVVDDDLQVHHVTRLVLSNFRFRGRPLRLMQAFSAREAAEFLAGSEGIAVAIVDVVMESDDAGLWLVRHIRDAIGNKSLRIILRTGQPGRAPEEKVILDYDINDYKEKTELSAQKLITSVVSALRSYDDIITIERLNAALGKSMGELRLHAARLEEAEDALRREMDFSIGVIQSSPSLICGLDARGGIVFANPAFERLTGFPVKEATRRRGLLRRLFPGIGGREELRAIFQHIRDGSHAKPVQVSFRAKDATIRTISLSFQKCPPQSRQRCRLLAFANDITEQVRAREEIAAGRNYLRNVFNSLKSAIVTTAPDGTALHWNDVAARLAGAGSGDTPPAGRHVFDIFPFLAPLEGLFHDTVAGGSFPPERVACGVKPRTRLYDVVFTLFTGANGCEVIVRMDDVTEAAEKDAQLQQAQKMEIVGRLAGGIAHDFNNMLNGVKGSVAMLEQMIEAGEMDREGLLSYVSLCKKAAQRSGDIVRQLLLLSRKHEAGVVPFNLNDSVRNVVDICKSSLDKRVEVKTKLAPGTAVLRGDAAQIEQALLNLCVNASHAMTIMRKEGEHQGGTLTVEVAQAEVDAALQARHPGASRGSHWVVHISDTGVGMTRETAEKIFEPFFTTKDQAHGTGLGLSMVSDIVKRHHGFIELESEPGVGTTFSVYLPIESTGSGPPR